MRLHCGICDGHSHDTPLMCASCANFLLLRPRLEYLDVLRKSSRVKHDVDSVLSKCIKGQNFDFVTQYIEKKKNSGDNVECSRHDRKGGPSLESITALSSQLLTIDAIVIKRRNSIIQREINVLKTHKQDRLDKLEELRRQVRDRKSRLESKRPTQEIQGLLKELKNENLYKEQDNRQLVKQINNSRSLLFQELINIYILKKRKISGTTRTIFMLSFTPILSASNLVDFNQETINGCLERMCKFIHQLSKVLLVTLPYAITFFKQSQYRPSIMKFDLWLKQQIWSLSTFDLRLLVNGISRLIVDVHFILKTLELNEGITKYSQLLRFDAMIYKLANNDYPLATQTPRESEEPRSVSPLPDAEELIGDTIDLEKLATMMYDVINKKINSKNNEWHFVKKEYLVDDE